MKDYEAQLGVKIEYSITGPAEEADAEGYVSALENAIASQPDAILTATLNIDPTVPKAKEAHDAGIVLNFVNCGLGNGDEGDEGTHGEYYNEFYYCSNTTIGEMAAQAFLDAMAEKGISTDKGTIGMQMNMENAALDFRMQGFRDYMAEKAPGLTLTDTEYNDNDSADAQADAENTINAVGADLIGIYAGLLPLMEELEANIYQYNEVDAELLSSQHDFQDGTITQQQYNSVVQAYEQLLKELDEEIDQQKAKLAEEGYYWEGAVLLNN